MIFLNLSPSVVTFLFLLFIISFLLNSIFNLYLSHSCEPVSYYFLFDYRKNLIIIRYIYRHVVRKLFACFCNLTLRNIYIIINHIYNRFSGAQAGWEFAQAGCYAQKDFVFSLILCCHCLEILKRFVFEFVFNKWSLMEQKSMPLSNGNAQTTHVHCCLCCRICI